MWKNYLTIAWRTMWRQRAYTAINITGLAVGLAFCALTFLFLRHEWGYDRFHENAERIYRVYFQMANGQGEVQRMADVMDVALGPAVAEGVPEAEQVVRLTSGRGGDREDQVVRVRRGETAQDEKFLLVDENFFELFSFPLMRGSAREVLSTRNSAILSAEMASRYFGDEDPIGERLTLRSQATRKEEDFVVTGVLAPLPDNSSIRPNFILPFASAEFLFHWDVTAWENSCNVYLLLKEGAEREAAERKIRAIVAEHMRPREGSEPIPAAELPIYLQPLSEIHSDTDFFVWIGHGVEGMRSPVYGYLLMGIAALVLAVACINFTNLALGRAATRSREVGVRKVVGATRSQLRSQFGGEAILTTFAALVVGVALTELFLPAFNGLTGLELEMEYGRTSTLPAILLLGVGVGALAGAYPAAVLSRFDPVRILRGDLPAGSSGRLARWLVVAQFAVSVFFIACSLLMQQQMRLMSEKDLGFNEENLLVIDTDAPPDGMGFHGPFKERVLQHANVLGVTASRYKLIDPLLHLIRQGYAVRDDAGREVTARQYRVDYDFLSTLQMDLVAGRDFEEERDTPETGGMIVNEAFVRSMGWDDPLGRSVQIEKKGRLSRHSSGEVQVIGVVGNFQFASLREATEPAALLLSPSMTWENEVMIVRVGPGDVAATIDFIEQEWQVMVPEEEFLYSFLDQDLEHYYRGDALWVDVVHYGALFSVGIACMGALGLALLAASRRTKEIGLRKTMGASVTQMAMLISREFAAMVLVATLLALPLVYGAMTLWLRDFVYRVGSVLEFSLLSGVVVLVVVLLPVGIQAVKVARTNPVEALRYE
jgi:putative ABC transport system permease protein